MPGFTYGSMQTVLGVGEYQMGDRDTKADAVRLALEAAKQNALEQVAVYVESVSEANGTDLSKEEVRSYTAGIVFIENQQVTTRLDGQAIVIRVELSARVDPAEVTQAIMALRERENARTQLAVLQAEIDGLHYQLENANAQLSAAGMSEDVQQARQQRRALLDQIQSNDLLAQAWTAYSLSGAAVLYSVPLIGMMQAQGLWIQSYMLYPGNPRLGMLQQNLNLPTATQGAFPRLFDHPRPRDPMGRETPWQTWPSDSLPPTLHQVPASPHSLGPRQPFADQGFLGPNSGTHGDRHFGNHAGTGGQR